METEYIESVWKKRKSRDLSIYIEAVAGSESQASCSASARLLGVRKLGSQLCVRCCRNSGNSGGDSSASGKLPHDKLTQCQLHELLLLFDIDSSRISLIYFA